MSEKIGGLVHLSVVTTHTTTEAHGNEPTDITQPTADCDHLSGFAVRCESSCCGGAIRHQSVRYPYGASGLRDG